jgi:hypothetical protein
MTTQPRSREERRREALETSGLRTVDGWLILALYLEGRLTLKQCVAVNSRRVRLLNSPTEQARRARL